ncbi:metal ABC transporter solute-binding protein, Zn/Mn family [Candidatus Avelusimicrobium gallicola]|uniref:ABC transporter substrate-binding protein n=1 Tax=Candidatus Avelusimicrobium gallicola TaxID=2562704 RepID=A0A1Y4DIS1_9BACT|nr:zinc ABC transporter substrate-binding protein [Elusimicrobium sp. An273]OUO56210.1 hypothetical protein B5F75_06220 [Elusimicrobium sp. An273]
MKKHLPAVLFLLAAALIWWLSLAPRRHQVPVAEGAKPRVVTSGYVPYTLAKQLSGGLADVTMLLPANAEPHSFEPTPGALVTVKNADIFIYVSDRIEPWAKDVLSSAGEQTAVVQAAKYAASSDDPHVWMDFQNAKQIARAISFALVQKDPSHRAEYEAHLKAFEKELAELDAAYQTGLASCQSRQVVHVGHLAFGNLTKNYGLSLSALAGSSHDGENSVRRVAELIRFIKDNQIRAIFTEETLSPRLSAAVAEETGAQVLPLYTVEHVSKDDFDRGVTYGELMRRNLDSLQRGLGCQA